MKTRISLVLLIVSGIVLNIPCALVPHSKAVDVYDFLNKFSDEKIDPSTPVAVRKKICRALLGAYHPDRNKSGTEMYMNINNACRALEKGKREFFPNVASVGSKSQAKTDPTKQKSVWIEKNYTITEPFQHIALETMSHVFITASADAPTLVLKGHRDVIEATKIVLKDGTLKILQSEDRKKQLARMTSACLVDNLSLCEDTISLLREKGKELEIYIGIPLLKSMRADGAEMITISGLIGDACTLDMHGVGTIAIENAFIDTLHMNIARKALANLSGKVDAFSLRVHQRGYGKVDATKLKAHIVDIALAGMGEISVAPLSVLYATISGIGDISYNGAPEVIKNITGLGTVRSIVA